MKTAVFRFYEELNDFLPPDRRKVPFDHEFSGSPAIKDTIETLGVPHTEVDLIRVNDVSVGFDYHLDDGDRVAVYPMFESLDIGPVQHLRPEPLRKPRFIADAHLGRLAAYLRMAGFDTLYFNPVSRQHLIAVARDEHRAILTRSRDLLKDGRVTHGYWLRSQDPGKQLGEVLRRFDLCGRLAPFSRCMHCNRPVEPIAKADVIDRLPPKVKAGFDRFRYCPQCDKIYWQGTHAEKMQEMIDTICIGY